MRDSTVVAISLLDVCTINAALDVHLQTRGEENAEGDEKLIGANEGTANPWRCGLGLEHGNNETESTDTEASDQAANHDLFPCSFSGNLDDETDGSDEAPEGDGVPATKLVGDGGGAQGTDEGTDGEETDDQTGADVAELDGAVGLVLAEPVEKVGHLQESGDLTRVIAKDHATHGDEDTHGP